MVYHFYVELGDSDPLVWRRIVVPAKYSFYKLHMALQGAFGWENSYLFQFSESGLSDQVCYGIPYDLEPDELTKDARKTKLSKVLKREGQSYFYVYDFGDYWKHRIVLEKIEAKDMDFPYCINGSGACPPEDIGGMHGYNEMIEIFRAPNHPQKQEYVEWLGLGEGEKWDPVFCSIREVNKRLCLLE